MHVHILYVRSSLNNLVVIFIDLSEHCTITFDECLRLSNLMNTYSICFECPYMSDYVSTPPPSTGLLHEVRTGELE